jgi:hypothetical protein
LWFQAQTPMNRAGAQALDTCLPQIKEERFL